MQAAYFGYSIINDVFGSNIMPSECHKASSSVSVLQRIRDLIAASIAFPGSLVNFWYCLVYAFCVLSRICQLCSKKHWF